ncbi:hypothetical protein Acr_17g0012530 [Actinidia rufa]|uniref:CCHC-type domain-containing protein n=1 Tax=Actinidia rufa TaxID=165716 RepID=A0A7J0G4E9_9ERIC|nr:hypothetical protein Acr_17g0012530 [Actinidia rufa]
MVLDCGCLKVSFDVSWKAIREGDERRRNERGRVCARDKFYTCGECVLDEWCIRDWVWDIHTQGLAKALKGKDAKSETMKDDDWEELMMKCVSTIRLCITDNIINNVMDEDEDSASALWEKLEKLYLAKSLTNKLHLKRQLYRLKMEEGGSLMEHMNVFNDTVSLEQVQSSLVSHCTQKGSSFEDGESAALAVQSGNRGKKSDGRSGWSNGSSSSSRGKGVQCYYCKEFGHVKRDCPLRKDKGKKCDDASSCNSLVVADDGDCLTVSEGGAMKITHGARQGSNERREMQRIVSVDWQNCLLDEGLETVCTRKWVPKM